MVNISRNNNSNSSCKSSTNQRISEIAYSPNKNNSEYVMLELIQFSEKNIEKLAWAYDHPFQLLVKKICSKLLKLLSSFRFVIPYRQRKRFRKSADKRRGKYFYKKWNEEQKKLFGSLDIPGGSLTSTSELNIVLKTTAEQKNLLNPNKILVADYRIPRADVSAGEKATIGILNDLVCLGYDVTFVPADMTKNEPYARRLDAIGVKLITSEDGYNSLSDYIEKNCSDVGTFYFIRVDVAEKGLLAASRVAPFAKKIFHAPDLYFLREMREAILTNDPTKLKKAEDTKQRELRMMQLSDHIVVVSPAEIPFLKQYLPEKSISVMPALYVPVIKNIKPFNKRKDIFFLGGFAHKPNIDSILWFANEVWPLIHQALPDVQFHIIGAEAPESVKAIDKKPGIHFVGYVEDLIPELEKYRLGVAPLLYGAGIKGKVAMTMGAGIPCICTKIAAEGMDITDNQETIIADNAEEFANATIKLYQDKKLWDKFSLNGQKLVERKFSEAANRADFLATLEQAKVLPVGLYYDFIKKSTPHSFPFYSTNEVIDVSIIIPVYNKWELTENCLKSILQSCATTSIKYEIILADDHSTDKTTQAETIFPHIRISRTHGNLGFLLNCNFAAKIAKGRYLLFLNNDTIVFPDWLQSLYDAMEEDPTIGLAGSKLLYPDGTIQEAGGRLFADGSAINMAHGEARYCPQGSERMDVSYISGASILVRSEIWQYLGGFDERYQPAYCEDSDLALSIWNLGFCVKYIPESEVIHLEHSSYSDEKSFSPQERQKVNNEKLFEKWQKLLKNVENFAPDPKRIENFKKNYAKKFSKKNSNH